MSTPFNIKEYNLSYNKNDYLWKFVSIEKFLSIVLNKKLYFTRIDCFEDVQEGISPELLLLNHRKNALMSLPPFNVLSQYHSIDMFPSETDNLIDKLKETQKCNFANCWYLSNENIESVAMWNLYSQPNSVALNIKFSDFYDKILKIGVESRVKLKSLILGKIKYVNFQNPIELDKIKEEIENTAFLKDQSFIHENEFRFVAEIEKSKEILFFPKEGFSKYMQKEFFERTSQLYGFDINLNDFLDYKFEIVFHPKMSDWVKKDLKNILEKFQIPFKTRDSKLKLK